MCKQTDAHSLRNTQVDTHPQNHMYTEMHTADIHRRKHTDRPTPPPKGWHVETDTTWTHTHIQTPENALRQTPALTHDTRTQAHSLPQRLPLPQDSAPGLPGAGGGARMVRSRAPRCLHSPGTLTGPTGMTGPDTPGRAPPTRNQQPNNAATIAPPPRLCRLLCGPGGGERGQRGALAQCAVAGPAPPNPTEGGLQAAPESK